MKLCHPRMFDVVWLFAFCCWIWDGRIIKLHICVCCLYIEIQIAVLIVPVRLVWMYLYVPALLWCSIELFQDVIFLQDLGIVGCASLPWSVLCIMERFYISCTVWSCRKKIIGIHLWPKLTVVEIFRIF